MAWYEATVGTRADITTLELDADMIRASRRTIDHFGLGDRVRLLEGPAAESIETLTDQFDLVFVDANKDGYEGYVKQILDRGLLSTRGLILCDNGENGRRLHSAFLVSRQPASVLWSGWYTGPRLLTTSWI